MVGLGFGLFLAGYSLAAYGWSQVRGCNSGLVGIVWPGSFKGCNADSGGTPAGGGSNPNSSGSQGPTATASRAKSPTSRINIGGGRTVPAKDIPGGKGSGVSP